MDNIVIYKNTEKKINEFNKHGFIEGGHNGPYYDPETPVRNTAHASYLFLYYYPKTGEQNTIMQL